VQVDPIKPPLEVHGIRCLNLNSNILPSNFGIKFNLRCYILASFCQLPFLLTAEAKVGRYTLTLSNPH